MKLFLPICLSCLFCSAALCDDISLKTGRILKDVSISDQGADFLRVHHAEGIVTVSYAELTEDMQKKYNMTEEDVQSRLEDKRRKAEKKKAQQDEASKVLRDSFSEAEKSPRYISGADMLKMMSLVTSVTPVEAEYAALVWNRGEARRLGLNDQESLFMQQIALYEPRAKEVSLRRSRAEEQEAKERKMLQEELAATKKNADKLLAGVSSMRRDIAQLERQKQEVKTVYVQTPVYVENPRPPIIINRPICPPSHNPPVIIRSSGGEKIGAIRGN